MPAFVANSTAFGRAVPDPIPDIQLSGTAWTPNRDGSDLVLTTDFPQLPLRSWVTVVGTQNDLSDIREAAQYLNQGGADGFNATCLAWGGGARDATRKAIYLSSGGHGNASSCENGIYEMLATKMRFARVVDRSPVANALRHNGSALVSGEGWGAGINYPTSEGRPGSTHTYDGLIHIPPALAASLGLSGCATRGGLFYHGQARGIYDLDTSAGAMAAKLWWKLNGGTEGSDWSNYHGWIDGNIIYSVRTANSIRRFDLSLTEMTDWQTSGFDGTPLVESLGEYLTSRTVTSNLDYSNSAFARMTERREVVFFKGNQTAQRLRYGAAIDAAASNWETYLDAITLTSDNSTDHLDFATANFVEGNTLLYAAGFDYDHATETLWVQANTVGGALYQITGLGTNTWTVLKHASGAALTLCTNGTFGRMAGFDLGGKRIATRVSAVGNALEVMRLN
jgi:hypothetical protein